MATCHGCKKTIWIKPIKRDEEAGYTIRANNVRDTHYEQVTRCVPCWFKREVVKAVNATISWAALPLALALSVFLAMLAVGWLLDEKEYAPTQTVAITAIDGRPVLIPPRVSPVLTRR
jgi:hypothetical protein